MQSVTALDSSPARESSRSSVEWGLAYALWIRDLMRLRAEPSRWVGVVLQPLLFWVVLGAGMGSVFHVEGLEGLDYSEYFFPGVIAMVMLFTAIFATMSVIEDRQTGFLQQVLVLPASRTAMVLGKTAGVTSVALLQAFLCVLAAPLAGYSLLSIHWPALFVVLTLGCIGLTALNFIMAWVISSTAGYHGIMSVFLLPMWMLSGAMYPAGQGWTATLMQFNPMAYLVDGTRHALYGGVAPVAQSSLGTSIVVLASLAIFGTWLASVVVHRRIEQGRA